MKLRVYKTDLKNPNSHQTLDAITFESFKPEVQDAIRFVGSAVFCTPDNALEAKIIYAPSPVKSAIPQPICSQEQLEKAQQIADQALAQVLK